MLDVDQKIDQKAGWQSAAENELHLTFQKLP